MIVPFAAALAALTLASPAVPTAAEAKKVLDYYYQGYALGPLLVELKACLKVDVVKDSPTKSECVEPVKGPVKKNTVVHAWALLVVPDPGGPKDAGTPAESELTVQYVFADEVKASMDLQLPPAMRTRTWRSSALGKSGKWELRIVRAGKVLGSVPVTVE